MNLLATYVELIYNKHMETKLIQIRIKSTVTSIVTFLLTGIVTFILSPETVSNVLAIVSENFGNSAIVSLLVLILPEVAKDFRNRRALKKLGSLEEEVILI